MKTSLKYRVLSSLFTVIFSSHFVLWGQTCSTFSDLNDIYFKDDIIIYSRLHFVAEEYANRMLQFTNIDASDFESKLQQTANCFVEASMPDKQEDRTIIFLILSSRTIAATESTSNFATVQDFTEVSAQKASAKDWIEALPILTDDEKRELYNILLDEFKQSHSPEFIQAEQEFMGGLFSEKEGVSSQRPPEIQIVNLPQETKDVRQALVFFANSYADIQSLDVLINGKRQNVRDHTTIVKPNAWTYSQFFDLTKGENGEKENTVIIECVDVTGRKACDTITIIYNPDNFMDRKDYAILFAVDDYSNVERCGNLFKPIEDAEKFAKILAEEYGFDTLVVRNPTKRSINSTIKTYQKKEYGPVDQLLIFYAGHGYFDDFGLGYIVPSDGDIDDDDKLVDYASLAAKINGISCSHILFICDACHSGSFLTLQRAPRPDIQMQNEVMKNKSRLFLGSCLAKDETPDKSALMDKICKKLRDQDRNMPIDFYSLIGLTYTTGNTTEEKQKAFGEFGDHEIGGDFFFNKK